MAKTTTSDVDALDDLAALSSSKEEQNEQATCEVGEGLEKTVKRLLEGKRLKKQGDGHIARARGVLNKDAHERIVQGHHGKADAPGKIQYPDGDGGSASVHINESWRAITPEKYEEVCKVTGSDFGEKHFTRRMEVKLVMSQIPAKYYAELVDMLKEIHEDAPEGCAITTVYAVNSSFYPATRTELSPLQAETLLLPGQCNSNSILTIPTTVR